MAARRFALGVDYGTNTCRALLVDVEDGTEVATSVCPYPSGTLGVLLDPQDPNLARQNPSDYHHAFFVCVKQAVGRARKVRGFRPEGVVGIGVDTTGSTPIPVDRTGTPLAFRKAFRRNLAAQAWLWKDHTAHAEAAEITEKARSHPDRYLAKCGGTYSSEWYWSKLLHCRRTAPEVFREAWSWVELADYIPAWLTGNTDPATLVRGVCAAGHKAMYHEDWGGLPSRDFLASLDPELAEHRDRFRHPALTADRSVGKLAPEIARKVGLPAGIPVAAGAFDAHMGAVGAGIRPGVLVKILGTSTCDMMVAPLEAKLPDIPGLCGIVPGSIVPGMYGLEAGQSAVGDIFAWFARHLCPPEYARGRDPQEALTRAAARLRPGESGLLALDWNHGNRTILVDPRLTGLLMGQTLHTSAPEVYRALIEATAFGALTIIRRFEEYGLKVDEVVTCGGIAEKNSLVMQIYADVLGRPMKISRSAQTCALGAAIFGAVAAGAHPDVPAAQARMTGLKPRVFRPDPEAVPVYAQLYALYRQLHDAFGTSSWSGPMYDVMKRLIALRDRIRGSR